MKENRSLDEFVDVGSDDEPTADDESGANGEAGAHGEAGTDDESGANGGAGAGDAEQSNDESATTDATGETGRMNNDPTANDDGSGVEQTDDEPGRIDPATVEPIEPTLSGQTGACERCGERSDERWEADGQLVCPDCKEW